MSSLFKNLSPEAGVAIGIPVGLLSTCVQSLGLTLQRKSHMLEDENANAKDRPHRPSYRRRRWQVGMVIFLLANIIGSSIQITTLPLPLLSTLQASGLVFNSAMATLLLKEPWTWKTGYGTALVAGGAVLISFFSAVPEPSHNLQQLLSLLKQRDFLVWFILSLVFVCATLVMDFTMRKCVPERRRDVARFQLVRGMSYGMISGILSAHALLLAKSAVELIVRSVADKQNQFGSYQSWLLVLAFVVLALSQLYYLHLGLNLISTSILYPFVFCIYNIVAILDGLIYFRQMDRLPPLHAGLIALGTVVLLSGVLALSWRYKDDEDAHTALVQAEIPQTLLVPGSGFVADHDDEAIESDEISNAESDREDAGEADELLINIRPRRKSASRYTKLTIGGTRHKRAHTLREMSELWNEMSSREGSLKPSYGTFMPSQPSESDSRLERPRTVDFLSQELQDGSSRDSNLDHVEAGPVDLSETSEPLTMRKRAQTMPNIYRAPSRRRRRKSGYEGGALFSDLLKMDWWSSQREPSVDDNEHDARPRSSREV